MIARSVSNCILSIWLYLFISRFGFKSGICLLIAPVPVHCVSINSTKIYENGMILFLILLIYRSLMAMSLNVPLKVYIYLNLFALPEHLRMLLTLIIVTNS